MFSTNMTRFKQAATLLLCGLLPCLCLAQKRSIDEALQIAREFKDVNMTEGRLTLASAGKEGQAKEEAYYIFTSPDIGFVIVSGDGRMPDILAYSNKTRFSICDIPPNVQYWLDCYAECYAHLDSISDEALTDGTTNEEAREIPPLLGNIKWGQSNPYNQLCPSVRGEKCVTGCVATAMAQVMKHHGYPTYGKGSISYRTHTNGIQLQNNLNNLSFKWENILEQYDGNYTTEQANAVAELMFACGISVRMDYCTSSQGGSGAYQSDLIPAFIENFGYDSDAAFMARGYCTNDDWHQALIRELNEGRPVNYGGQSTRDGGHSFVLDGYLYRNTHNRPFYHVNWGWDGSCDGYYQITDLHPSEKGQYYTYDGFNSSQQMTLGIKPEDGIDNEVFVLCTPNLYASNESVTPGSTIQVYSSELGNFSYKTFNGTLHVALTSKEDGTEVILGDSRVQTLDYLQRQNNPKIEITLPSNLNKGEYTIQLRSKPTRGKVYSPVYSKSYPILIVSESGKPEPSKTKKAELACTELEIRDSTIISLNIYGLQNFKDVPFIGDLRMILADSNGKQLVAFGDSVQPGELSMNEIREYPLMICGTLAGDWPDGNYRIYVGARLINTSIYTYLSFYDVTQPGITGPHLYLNAHIENGTLIINGKSYDIIPTFIKEFGGEGATSLFSYSLNGSRWMSNKHPGGGINIVRRSDGSVRKVVAK